MLDLQNEILVKYLNIELKLLGQSDKKMRIDWWKKLAMKQSLKADCYRWIVQSSWIAIARERWRFYQSTADLCSTSIVSALYVASATTMSSRIPQQPRANGYLSMEMANLMSTDVAKAPHSPDYYWFIFIADYAHCHCYMRNNDHLQFDLKLNSKLKLSFP